MAACMAVNVEVAGSVSGKVRFFVPVNWVRLV